MWNIFILNILEQKFVSSSTIPTEEKWRDRDYKENAAPDTQELS